MPQQTIQSDKSLYEDIFKNYFKKILQSHEKYVKPKGVYFEKSDRFAFFLFDGTKRREM